VAASKQLSAGSSGPVASAAGVQAPAPFLDNRVLDTIISYLDASSIASLRVSYSLVVLYHRSCMYDNAEVNLLFLG